MVFINHQQSYPYPISQSKIVYFSVNLRGKGSDQIGWIDPALWRDLNTPHFVMNTPKEGYY